MKLSGGSYLIGNGELAWGSVGNWVLAELCPGKQESEKQQEKEEISICIFQLSHAGCWVQRWEITLLHLKKKKIANTFLPKGIVL